ASTSPGPSFTVIERAWSRGDTVTITLAQDIALQTWGGRGGVSVTRGPLFYSLQIGEKYTQFAGDSEFPEYDVTPTTPWNYGLTQPSPAAPGHAKVTTRPVRSGVNPFTHDGAPVMLRTTARRLPSWQADAQQVVRTLQPGPTSSAEHAEEITL